MQRCKMCGPRPDSLTAGSREIKGARPVVATTLVIGNTSKNRWELDLVGRRTGDFMVIMVISEEILVHKSKHV